MVWAADLDDAHIRVVHVHRVIRDDSSALYGLWKTFGLPHFPDERDSNEMRACAHGRPKFKPRVSADLHVLFPRVVAGEARFAVSFIACGCGAAFCFAADGEAFQQASIQANVKLL